MNDEIKEIKFIKYNGIEGYIELMKHDVEPLNNPECKGIELYYDGKDIKAVLDYITNLQEENERLKAYIKYLEEYKPNYYKGEKIYGIDYKSRCEKAIEYIENKIEYLNEQKRLITNILTPQNGYLKTDIEIEISKYQELLNILNGSDE